MKPITAIPMGDPANIGPGIVAEALAREKAFQYTRCVVVGDRKVVEQAVRIMDLPMTIHVVKKPGEGRFEEYAISLMDLDNVGMGRLRLGEISSVCSQIVYEYITESIPLVDKGKVAAMSTTPINKEPLRVAGVPFIGHTEVFGVLTDTLDPLTMFEMRNMRVSFLARRVPLRKACDIVTKERVMGHVEYYTQALRQLGVEDEIMAIAGLNPHSGEHGLFGDEEMGTIYPAVGALQTKGYRVVGPVGANPAFYLTFQGKFNSVLSLYHGQGHTATKTLDFKRIIAVTAGMPVLRTSVDHGTTMDITGMGITNNVSMVEAIRLAAKHSSVFLRKDGN